MMTLEYTKPEVHYNSGSQTITLGYNTTVVNYCQWSPYFDTRIHYNSGAQRMTLEYTKPVVYYKWLPNYDTLQQWFSDYYTRIHYNSGPLLSVVPIL
nr:hypothetical protein BgiMline_011124 [Biomphalaria glabrata]